MLKLFGWMLPASAALALVIGFSTLPARAADDAKTGKGNISGTVMDKDGKAVEGVEVRLVKPRPPRNGGGGGGGAGEAPKSGGDSGKLAAGGHRAIPLQNRPAPIATATTDKDGKFTMNDVEAGDYNLMVRDTAKKAYGREKVTVEDGKTATVEIKCTDTPPQRGGGGGGGGGGGNKSGGGSAGGDQSK
jgi:hypothetical protein